LSRACDLAQDEELIGNQNASASAKWLRPQEAPAKVCPGFSIF
jgi:hypothetical protein